MSNLESMTAEQFSRYVSTHAGWMPNSELEAELLRRIKPKWDTYMRERGSEEYGLPSAGTAREFLRASDKFAAYDTNGAYLMKGYELESMLEACASQAAPPLPLPKEVNEINQAAGTATANWAEGWNACLEACRGAFPCHPAITHSVPKEAGYRVPNQAAPPCPVCKARDERMAKFKGAKRHPETVGEIATPICDESATVASPGVVGLAAEEEMLVFQQPQVREICFSPLPDAETLARKAYFIDYPNGDWDANKAMWTAFAVAMLAALRKERG